MAESQQYLLGNERFVTVNIDEDNSEIYKINSDGTRLLYADFNNGTPTASTLSPEDFQRNIAQGNYTDTIKKSIDNSRGLPPTQTEDPNGTGTPGGSTPTNTTSNQQSSSPTSSQLRYPLNNTGGYDYLMITTYKRNPTEIFKGDKLDVDDAAVTPVDDPVVVLPMQPGISDNNSVSWGSDNLSALQLVGARAAAKMIPALANLDPGKAAKKAFDVIKSSAGAAMDDIKKDDIISYFAGRAVGSNIFTRATGKVLNPNLELLFTGPNLRSFNYNYVFTPRDPDEARVVKQIIRHFKKNMAVRKSNGGLFLETPYVFKLKYIYSGGDQHPFLNKIKTCALTNLDVQYTPDGSYMTYKDGSMTSYQMSMTFQELSPIYAKDYEEDTDNMGY